MVIFTSNSIIHLQVSHRCWRAAAEDATDTSKMTILSGSRTDGMIPLQDDLDGLEAPEGFADDVLLTEDDDLDRHPAMLPAVQLVERAAVLWAESSASRQGGHCRFVSFQHMCLQQHPGILDHTEGANVAAQHS